MGDFDWRKLRRSVLGIYCNNGIVHWRRLPCVLSVRRLQRMTLDRLPLIATVSVHGLASLSLYRWHQWVVERNRERIEVLSRNPFALLRTRRKANCRC